MAIASSMYNAAARAVAARHNARGIAYAVVSACASSAHAIGQAYQSIRGFQADAMLAGGADAPLTFGIMRSWESTRLLAIYNGEQPPASRPFSADRECLALPVAAAVPWLKSYDSVQRRWTARP